VRSKPHYVLFFSPTNFFYSMQISLILLAGAVCCAFAATAQQPQTQRTKTDQQRTDTSPTSQQTKKLNPTNAKASTSPTSGTISTGSKNPPPGSSIGWDTRQAGSQDASNTSPASGMNSRRSDESKAQSSRNVEKEGSRGKGPTGAPINTDPKRGTRAQSVPNDPGQQTSTEGKSPDVKVDPSRMRRASGNNGTKPGN